MNNGALLAISPEEGLAGFAPVGWSCFQHGVYEPHVERALRRLLRPGDTAYDIGANLGYHSAVMAQTVGPTGHVVAFEPVPETFARLALCGELNSYSQLIPFQMAVGSTSGTVELRLELHDSGHASMYPTPWGASGSPPGLVKAPIFPLDEIMSTHKLSAPRLMKIDVEGHEMAVLSGATRILEQHRPTLVFELNPPLMREAAWTASDVEALLRRYGPYKFFLVGDEEPKSVELAQLVLDEGTFVEIIASVSAPWRTA